MIDDGFVARDSCITCTTQLCAQNIIALELKMTPLKKNIYIIINIIAVAKNASSATPFESIKTDDNKAIYAYKYLR